MELKKIGFFQHWNRNYNISVQTDDANYTIVNPAKVSVEERNGKIAITVRGDTAMIKTRVFECTLDMIEVEGSPLLNCEKTVKDYVKVIREMFTRI